MLEVHASIKTWQKENYHKSMMHFKETKEFEDGFRKVVLCYYFVFIISKGCEDEFRKIEFYVTVTKSLKVDLQK